MDDRSFENDTTDFACFDNVASPDV